MRLLTLHDLTNVTSLYSLQMRYLLSTQQQFSRGLEGMIDAASDQALKDAFRSHLQGVSLQPERIDQIVIELTSKADDAKCAITSSLIASVEKIVRETDRGAVRDAWLVAGARKIESFEIASYHAALQWASLLSYAYHVSLLQETLDEEVRADGKLRDIERRINQPPWLSDTCNRTRTRVAPYRTQPSCTRLWQDHKVTTSAALSRATRRRPIDANPHRRTEVKLVDERVSAFAATPEVLRDAILRTRSKPSRRLWLART